MDKDPLPEKLKHILETSHLIPAAQATTFRKFLALLDLKEADENNAIVNICNGHGVQLRTDVNFIQAEKSSDSTSAVAPVLNQSHLHVLKDFNDLINKLTELPSEWTIVQLSRELDPMDVVGLTKQHGNADPTLLITRLSCGKNVHSAPPYCVSVPPAGNMMSEMNIVERLAELMRLRREFYNNQRDKQIQSAFNTSDAGLASCLSEMETYWLREWKCLLHGRLVDSQLEKEIREKVEKLMQHATSKTCRNAQKCSDILFHIAVNAHHLKAKELMKALKLALYEDENWKGDNEELTVVMDDIKSLNTRNANALKKTGRHPVILITEPSLELIPWEMTTVLTGHPVCRVLSVHLLYALYKHHKPHIYNGYRHLPVSSAYCLLNPDKSLIGCEKKMGEFLKKELPWVNVQAGVIPDPVQLISHLSDDRIFMYCGHGSASQYFKFGAIKKTPMDGLVLLYGCSSNLPRGHGGRTPYQNDTYTYLTNGCPCLIGALYDITSSDADRACMKTMSSMLPTVTNSRGSIQVNNPLESDVLQAVLLGKEACHKFWSKCCFVARGIPVKIIFTETEKAAILQQIQR